MVDHLIIAIYFLQESQTFYKKRNQWRMLENNIAAFILMVKFLQLVGMMGKIKGWQAVRHMTYLDNNGSKLKD